MSNLHPHADKYDTPEKISDLLVSIEAVQETHSELTERIKESEKINTELADSLKESKALIADLSDGIDERNQSIKRLKAQVGESPNLRLKNHLSILRGVYQKDLDRASEGLEEFSTQLNEAKINLQAVQTLEGTLKP